MAKNFPFGLPELPVPELVPVVLEEAPKTERDWYEHLTELIYSIQGSRKRLSGRMRKVLRRHARRAARGLCAADGAVRSKVQIMGPDGPETTEIVSFPTPLGSHAEPCPCGCLDSRAPTAA